MKVSVLIPVYNSENYLAEAIESVLNQSFKEFELVVVDDGSSDNSLNIAKEHALKDKRVKVLHKKNGGRASALNYALGICSGEYLAFLDSDDIMADNRLKIEAEFLDKHKEIDLVYGDMIKFWADGKEELREAVDFDSSDAPLNVMIKFYNSGRIGEILPHLLYSNSKEGKAILGGSVMVRRRVFDFGIKHDENMGHIEDTDLWLQIIGQGFKVKRIPKVMFYYRIHSGQISSEREKMVIAGKKVYAKFKRGEYFSQAILNSIK